MDSPTISIDPDRCQLCGQCVPVCTRGIIELGHEAAEVKHHDRCILCGHCKSVCPEDAPQLHSLDPGEFEPVPDKDRIPAPEALLSFFRSRRSIRFYKKDTVPQAHLEKIIQAGRFAPTGGNRQPVRYVIIHTPGMIDTVRTMTHAYFAGQAETVLATNERHKQTGEALPPRFAVSLGYAPLWKSMDEMYRQGRDVLFHFAPAITVLHADPEIASSFCADAGLAAMQMVLMAQSLGLGTCFCGFLTLSINNHSELKNVLRIPAENKAILTFMVGYPDITFHKMVSRKPAEVTYL